MEVNSLINDDDSELAAAADATYRRSPHAAALCAAVLTLPLLYVGGSVTTYRVGLAVPDWPQTFGINMFLYNFWNAPFGVRLEHTHRLYGAAVGLATLFLAIWLSLFERRSWIKALGLVALLAVIVQGVLGGTRVTEVSTFLAAVHGVMGQAFFGLMVALVVLTGRKWQGRPVPEPDVHLLRRRPLFVLVLLLVQLGVGSWLRHYGAITALGVHAVLALTIWGHALAWAVRVERGRPELAAVAPSSRAFAVLSTLQVALGVASFVLLWPFDGTPRAVSFYQAVIRTGHQTCGALVLGAAVVTTLRTFGLFCRFHAAAPERARSAKASGLDWEGAR